jgi:hypothetical protein
MNHNEWFNCHEAASRKELLLNRRAELRKKAGQVFGRAHQARAE